MNKTFLLLVAITLASCGSTQVNSLSNTNLYEVITQQQYGGASIEFYEILSEPSEIKMLLNDPNLKGKINTNDLNQANFIILNMGEKPTGGYSIGISTIAETADAIVIKVKNTNPDPGSIVTQALTNPFCVVKINSKKEIQFK
ncbi:hypothetical protein RCH18_003159 [Flavobacterium sp. PL11]|uniref:protease complex subunit PrcB family protein n=1 Tax=Flavobacterium sp. PL11 TaxID=3071717 RepID=UPI002DFB9B93|nr:hypothetical protein [Flavobacterium sp. PL11]